jgi:hypothetical protein
MLVTLRRRGILLLYAMFMKRGPTPFLRSMRDRKTVIGRSLIIELVRSVHIDTRASLTISRRLHPSQRPCRLAGLQLDVKGDGRRNCHHPNRLRRSLRDRVSLQ